MNRNLGSYIELFNSNRRLLQEPYEGRGAVPGGISAQYDEEAECVVLANRSGVIHLPNEQAGPLFVSLRFLVFQLLLLPGKGFYIDILVQDKGKNTRHIQLSYENEDVCITPQAIALPLPQINPYTWTYVCVDLVSLVGDCLPGQQFRGVVEIDVGPPCLLARVFALRQLQTGTLSSDEWVPTACRLPSHVNMSAILVDMDTLSELVEGRGEAGTHVQGGDRHRQHLPHTPHMRGTPITPISQPHNDETSNHTPTRPFKSPTGRVSPHHTLHGHYVDSPNSSMNSGTGSYANGNGGYANINNSYANGNSVYANGNSSYANGNSSSANSNNSYANNNNTYANTHPPAVGVPFPFPTHISTTEHMPVPFSPHNIRRLNTSPHPPTYPSSPLNLGSSWTGSSLKASHNQFPSRQPPNTTPTESLSILRRTSLPQLSRFSSLLRYGTMQETPTFPVPVRSLMQSPLPNRDTYMGGSIGEDIYTGRGSGLREYSLDSDTMDFRSSTLRVWAGQMMEADDWGQASAVISPPGPASQPANIKPRRPSRLGEGFAPLPNSSWTAGGGQMRGSVGGRGHRVTWSSPQPHTDMTQKVARANDVQYELEPHPSHMGSVGSSASGFSYQHPRQPTRHSYPNVETHHSQNPSANESLQQTDMHENTTRGPNNAFDMKDFFKSLPANIANEPSGGGDEDEEMAYLRSVLHQETDTISDRLPPTPPPSSGIKSVPTLLQPAAPIPVIADSTRTTQGEPPNLIGPSTPTLATAAAQMTKSTRALFDLLSCTDDNLTPTSKNDTSANVHTGANPSTHNPGANPSTHNPKTRPWHIDGWNEVATVLGTDLDDLIAKSLSPPPSPPPQKTQDSTSDGNQNSNPNDISPEIRTVAYDTSARVFEDTDTGMRYLLARQ